MIDKPRLLVAAVGNVCVQISGLSLVGVVDSAQPELTLREQRALITVGTHGIDHSLVEDNADSLSKQCLCVGF